MASVCVFEFSKNNATYFSGENVTGTITLNITNAKHVKDISVVFLGVANVNFKGRNKYAKKTDHTCCHTMDFTAHETFLKKITRVQEAGILPAGIHTFKMNFALPLDCPTSYEGEYGHLRYKMLLQVNGCRCFNEYHNAVTVLKRVDLNLYPLHKLPLSFDGVSSSFLSCLKRNISIYDFKLPRGSYVPGEKVLYTLELFNQKFKGYKLKFYQEITFIAKAPHKLTKICKNVLVNESFLEDNLRLTTDVVVGEFLIPEIQLTTQRSDIINVEYIINICIQTSNDNSFEELEVPLFIGNIPLKKDSSARETTLVEQQPKEVNSQL